jgi:TPR repeat protein
LSLFGFKGLIQLFRRFAALHNPAAQYILGLCYYQGRGVDHDFSCAVHWLQLSAAKGYTDAVMALEEIQRQSFLVDRKDVLGSSLRHFNRVTDDELQECVNTNFAASANTTSCCVC